MNSTGFVLTAPASRKFALRNPPKNAATPVKRPRISAPPTNSSPYATRYENSAALGIATCCRNHAYQPCTSGCSPPVLVSAPWKKPVTAAPAFSPTHTPAGFVILPQPAVSHS